MRERAQFDRLQKYLRTIVDEPLTVDDYESAADVGNRCRRVGIVGTSTDLLLCAVSLRTGWPVFTTDGDFTRYAKVVPVRLHKTYIN